jgi:hypothetical protein
MNVRANALRAVSCSCAGVLRAFEAAYADIVVPPVLIMTVS